VLIRDLGRAVLARAMGGRSAAPAAPEPPEPAGQPVLLACLHPSTLRLAAQASPTLRLRPVRDFHAALEAARVETADAILVESAFADGRGLRLCAALRRLGSTQVPIVVACEAKEAAAAYAAGAAEVVRGRLDWAVLTQRVRALQAARAARAELERCQSELRQAREDALAAWTQIQRDRTTDRLTGLPNRAQFEDLLERAVTRSRGPGARVGLVLLDLDRFSEINETLGREAGDETLREVAVRLARHLRGGDRSHRPGSGAVLRVAGRLTGDEFAVLLTHVPDPGHLTDFADAVLESLRPPVAVAGTEVFLGATAGIAISSGGARRGQELFQQAEAALLEAKRRGGRPWRLYSPDQGVAVARKAGLDRRLRRALEAGDLDLHYQPILDVASGRLVAAEALLRWRDGEGGFVPPSEFVPVAEETGLMNLIGTWVVKRACRELRAWLDAGLAPVRMAVNISHCQLERGDLPAVVREALAETGLPGALLELELSERGVLSTSGDVPRQLRELKAMDVRLLVDDFGTGETSFTYLRRFPLDGLKIDRSFVDGLLEHGDDASITTAIVAMAHGLRLEVVAEGVEQAPQMEFLRDCGCEMAQGFLFSKAVPAEQFMELARERGAQARGAMGANAITEKEHAWS
jgi:diguanylate cyclase (GGDEF)-like protein